MLEVVISSAEALSVSGRCGCLKGQDGRCEYGTACSHLPSIDDDMLFDRFAYDERHRILRITRFTTRHVYVARSQGMAFAGTVSHHFPSSLSRAHQQTWAVSITLHIGYQQVDFRKGHQQFSSHRLARPPHDADHRTVRITVRATTANMMNQHSNMPAGSGWSLTRSRHRAFELSWPSALSVNTSAHARCRPWSIVTTVRATNGECDGPAFEHGGGLGWPLTRSRNRSSNRCRQSHSRLG